MYKLNHSIQKPTPLPPSPQPPPSRRKSLMNRSTPTSDILKELPLLSRPKKKTLLTKSSPTESLPTEDGECTRTNEQKKIAGEIVNELQEFCRKTADEIIEKHIRGKLEDYILVEIINALEKIYMRRKISLILIN